MLGWAAVGHDLSNNEDSLGWGCQAAAERGRDGGGGALVAVGQAGDGGGSGGRVGWLQ